MTDRYLSHREACEVTGLSRMTIWRAQRRGEFPPFEQISTARVGVLKSRVDRWLAGERSGWPCNAGGCCRGPKGSQGKPRHE